MGDLDHVYQGGARRRYHLRMLLAKSEVVCRLVPHLRGAYQARAAYHRFVRAVCTGKEARIVLSCDIVDHPADRICLQLLHQAFLLQV